MCKGTHVRGATIETLFVPHMGRYSTFETLVAGFSDLNETIGVHHHGTEPCYTLFLPTYNGLFLLHDHYPP